MWANYISLQSWIVLQCLKLESLQLRFSNSQGATQPGRSTNYYLQFIVDALPVTVGYSKLSTAN